jgi:hypothetical protein
MISVLVVAACDGQDSRLASTTFDGGKKLDLFAAYSVNADSVTIQAFADVPVGTQGNLEMTGPFHVRCKGQFRPPDPAYQAPDNLPYLDVGEGVNGTAGIRTPSGQYTATVAIPSKGASLRNDFHAGGTAPDVFHGLLDLPSGCVPVADSAHQMQIFLPDYVAEIAAYAAKMDPSPVRSQLLTLATEAVSAVSAADNSTALSRVTEIRDLVQPLSTDQYPYSPFVLRAALDAIALMTQPPPSR